MTTARVVEPLLDLARWAPSGDNTQPWRFEVLGDDHIVVHGRDTRHEVVYDLDGHPSQMAIGALLETLDIAASAFATRTRVSRRAGPDEQPTFDVHLTPDEARAASPLFGAIPRRSVQRRAMGTRALSAAEKQALQDSLLPDYTLRFLEGAGARWRVALLLFRSAYIRLTTREAWRVHRSIIAFGRRYSADRVPDQSLGADPVALRIMRWALPDWRRVKFMNRWFAGTWIPRLQMDLWPAWRSAAHIALVRKTPPRTIDDHIEAGRCMQRLWLTATNLGLQKQPEVTPLIFARFARVGRTFTEDAPAQRRAQEILAQARRVIGNDLDHVMWLCRVGRGPAAASRSQRRSRADLTLR